MGDGDSTAGEGKRFRRGHCHCSQPWVGAAVALEVEHAKTYHREMQFAQRYFLTNKKQRRTNISRESCNNKTQ